VFQRIKDRLWWRKYLRNGGVVPYLDASDAYKAAREEDSANNDRLMSVEEETEHVEKQVGFKVIRVRTIYEPRN
jgi:hypothetical protein